MAVIHNKALQPGKLELLARWLPEQPWYCGTGELTRAGGFRLDDPDGEVGSRWIYDGEHDPVLHAQLGALLRGQVLAQAQSQSDTLDPTVQVRPGTGAVSIRRLLTEDQPPEPPVGYVSVPWRRPDGSSARGVVATAGR